MIIDVDGTLITVPAHIEAKIIEQLFQMVEALYLTELPKPMRIGMKVYSRKKIADMEARMNAQGLDGRAIRPPDGEDPNLHYLKLMFASSQKVLSDAILLVDTEPDPSNKDAHTATAFSLSVPNFGQAGGSVLIGGNIGQWEDHGGEGTGPGSREVIPHEQALYLR